MTALIPTKKKKEDMTIEQLAGATGQIIIKLSKQLYKVVPEESLRLPDEKFEAHYGNKKEIRVALESLYDKKKNRNKTFKR